MLLKSTAQRRTIVTVIRVILVLQQFCLCLQKWHQLVLWDYNMWSVWIIKFSFIEFSAIFKISRVMFCCPSHLTFNVKYVNQSVISLVISLLLWRVLIVHGQRWMQGYLSSFHLRFLDLFFFFWSNFKIEDAMPDLRWQASTRGTIAGCNIRDSIGPVERASDAQWRALSSLSIRNWLHCTDGPVYCGDRTIGILALAREGQVTKGCPCDMKRQGRSNA